MDKTAKVYTKDYMLRPGMSFAIDIRDPRQRIQDFLDKYRNAPAIEGFEESLMTKDLTLISATGLPTVTAVFEMTISPMYGSRMGNAQGGAISLIHDMCTTMAVAPLAREDFWHFGGVSRTLSVTYLRPTKTGTDVVIECEVLQIGKRLATIRSSMKDKKTDNLLSICEHNKASIVFQEPSKL
jgi:acyl-coenzyme A thioesterase 13